MSLRNTFSFLLQKLLFLENLLDKLVQTEDYEVFLRSIQVKNNRESYFHLTHFQVFVNIEKDRNMIHDAYTKSPDTWQIKGIRIDNNQFIQFIHDIITGNKLATDITEIFPTNFLNSNSEKLFQLFFDKIHKNTSILNTTSLVHIFNDPTVWKKFTWSYSNNSNISPNIPSYIIYKEKILPLMSLHESGKVLFLSDQPDGNSIKFDWFTNELHTLIEEIETLTQNSIRIKLKFGVESEESYKISILPPRIHEDIDLVKTENVNITKRIYVVDHEKTLFNGRVLLYDNSENVLDNKGIQDVTNSPSTEFSNLTRIITNKENIEFDNNLRERFLQEARYNLIENVVTLMATFVEKFHYRHYLNYYYQIITVIESFEKYCSEKVYGPVSETKSINNSAYEISDDYDNNEFGNMLQRQSSIADNNLMTDETTSDQQLNTNYPGIRISETDFNGTIKDYDNFYESIIDEENKLKITRSRNWFIVSYLRNIHHHEWPIRSDPLFLGYEDNYRMIILAILETLKEAISY